MRLLPPIAANIVLLLAALGFGSTLQRMFPQGFSALDRLALTLLGGLGILGTLLFDLGHFWFSRTAIALILLSGVLLAFTRFAKHAVKLRGAPREFRIPFLPGIVVGSVLLVTAIGGLAQPTGGIHMDAVAYHLLGPKVWLRSALIRPLPDEALTAFPAVIETQYAAVMALGGQRAPEFYAVISLTAILLLALALAQRSGLDSNGAWRVAALILTMPVVYRGAYGGFIDVLFSAFVLAAVRIGFDAERPSHYAVLGLFCGFACGTKYTGLIAALLIALCTVAIAIIVRRHPTRRILMHLAIASAVAIVIAAPWYLRNWLVLGCPIYPPPPFLLHFFRIRYLSADALQHLLVRIRKEGMGMGRGPISFLLLPFHLTFHPANFINGAGGIGLTPLALAPLGLLAQRKNYFAAALASFAVLATLVWFYTAQEARYLIHGYVIAAIFAVWGWRYVVRIASRLGAALTGAVIACSILYGVFMITSARFDDMHAALSPSFEQQRRAQQVPFAAAFDYLNVQTAVISVLILDPLVPAYYLDKPYVKPFGRLGEQTLPDSNDIMSQLPALHVSHVLDVRSEISGFRVPPGASGLTLVFQRDDQRVYRVD
jgi:hypothetical protein